MAQPYPGDAAGGARLCQNPATTALSQGLYDPAYEHDACGVAFVADLNGRRSHGVVEKGLAALCRLDHRGARGAERADLAAAAPGEGLGLRGDRSDQLPGGQWRRADLPDRPVD